MRLFVAIELDDNARRAIGEAQRRITRALDASQTSSLRLVRPDHMHLTLAFLGEVAEERVPDLVAALERDIRLEPFVAVLGGVGVFPARGAPRVLWLGIRSGASSVTASQQEVVIRLDRLGIEREARPFHPHVTLARWRSSRSADARRAVGADPGEVARLQVDRVTLFQSELSSAGPTYRALTRATLTP